MGHRRLSPAQDSAIIEGEIRLGHVNGVFGYKGEVRLFLYNPKTELFSGTGTTVTLIDAKGARSERQLSTRPGAGKRILGRLSGVTDEAGARAMIGEEIVVDKATLPPPDEGEYYHHQLIGLPVVDESGTALGRIQEVIEGDEVDIWVVRGSAGEIMFPAVSDVVLSVSLEAGVVVASRVVS